MKTALITKMMLFGFALTISLMLGLSNAGAQCPPGIEFVTCECSVDSCASSDSDGAVTAIATLSSYHFTDLDVNVSVEINGVLVQEYSTSIATDEQVSLNVNHIGPTGDYATIITAESTNVVGTTTVQCDAPCFIPLCVPTIEEILEFFDTAVESGGLFGIGPTVTSAEGKLNAFRNMLEEAAYLIANGYIAEACQQLSAIYRKTDGMTPPPDFVAGEGSEHLAEMILALMNDLGCE